MLGKYCASSPISSFVDNYPYYQSTDIDRVLAALIIYLIYGTNLLDRRSIGFIIAPIAKIGLTRALVERRQKNELNEARFNMNGLLFVQSDLTHYKDNNLYFCTSPCFSSEDGGRQSSIRYLTNASAFPSALGTNIVT